MQTNKVPSWDELMQSLDTATQHPLDTAWNIYRYLNANLKQMNSEEARRLLAIYTKLPCARPSLLHSCILSVAVKMAGQFPDFRLPQFLDIWGYPTNLRQEDYSRQTGNDGKSYPSLKERVDMRCKRYASRQSAPEHDARNAIVGYVDRYDPKHQHFHIFDNTSRHFVAKNPKVTPTVNGFVRFIPVIPKEGNFKTAIILAGIPAEQGLQLFGTYEAKVKYVNTEQGYFYYTITSPIPETPEGTITQEGSASLSLAAAPLAVGQSIRIQMFLRRGKDRIKRNSVVKVMV